MRAVDDELLERAQHPSPGVLAVDVVHDELRDERVVEARDLVSAADTRVHAHADTPRLAVGRDSPRRGEESACHVLGVDPALDRVPAQHHVLLRDRERLAGRDEHLLAHDVDAGDGLRDRVLDLDAGVHLEEEVLAFLSEKPFDRSGRAVRHRTCGLDRERADVRTELRADGGRGRLLDELLVAALDGAVALAEMDDVPVTVREDLHLHVARVVEVPLDVHGRVREVRLALPLSGFEGTLDVVGRAGDAQPLPTATGGRLDRDRIADLVGRREHVGGASGRGRRSRHDRNPGFAHPRASRDLGAHGLDRVGRRADPHEPRRLDVARESGVLREEAVTGMDRLGSRSACDLDDQVAAQVRLAGRPWTEQEGLVRDRPGGGLRDPLRSTRRRSRPRARAACA